LVYLYKYNINHVCVCVYMYINYHFLESLSAGVVESEYSRDSDSSPQRELPTSASPATMETLSPVSSPTPPWGEGAARSQPSTVDGLRVSRRILAPNLVWDAFWSPAATIPGWDPKVSLGEMLLRSNTMEPVYPV
jgi:hypothetical protein